MENSKKWTMILSIALIGFNMVSIYVAIKLHGYDEILDYFTGGTIKRESPKGLAWLLFINMLCNILYAWAVFVAKLMEPDSP